MDGDDALAPGDVPEGVPDLHQHDGGPPGPELAASVEPDPSPTIVDLGRRSARLGIDVGRLMVGEFAGLSIRAGRVVMPPALAERPLAALQQELERRRDVARGREVETFESTKAAAEAVLNRVVVGVVDMLDMGELIDHVPVDEVVARVDLAAVVEEIDLGGIVRQSTAGLAGETLDAVRVGVMGLDLFGARVVDKVLRRKAPRDLSFDGYDVAGPEIHVPKDLR